MPQVLWHANRYKHSTYIYRYLSHIRPHVRPPTHSDSTYTQTFMDAKRYKRCGLCLSCTRHKYVRDFVTEDKDREKILSLGQRECEDPKDLTKRAKINTPTPLTNPCRCGCFRGFPCRYKNPPKPVMKIDHARKAADELAQQRKQFQENVLARVREQILQHDNEGAGQFSATRGGQTLLSHTARVRVQYSNAERDVHFILQASALQEELQAVLTALGKLCHVCRYECVHMEPYPLTQCGTCTLVVHAANVHDDVRPCSYKLSKWYDTVVCAPCRRDALRVDLTAD
jgi:hypothetical protein